MARPTKEGLDYFPHDVDLSSDEKIEAIEALYGNDGYAVYLKLLERIYRAGGSLKISAAETKQILLKKMNLKDLDVFEKMIISMVDFGLFDKKSFKKGQILVSNGIKKRVQVVVNKRVKMKERYNKKVSDAETTPETRQSKVKKRKEKESKEYIPPENHLVFDAEKTKDEIKDLQRIGMVDVDIKKHFIMRGMTEQQFDQITGKKF